MAELSTLKLGLSSLTYYFFNGVVESRRDSSHTETTYEQGTNRLVSSRTDHRSDLLVRGADGHTQQFNASAAHISIQEGARVTLVMATRSENGEMSFVAVRDHGTGQTGFFAKGVNDVAGPPLYNMGLIVAVFVGLFAVVNLSFGNFLLLALVGGFFYELFRRRKLVRAHAGQVIAKYCP